MPLAPKSMPDVEQPALTFDPAAIREQLQKLLSHPLFANSKRYPALLAYTVVQTLLGNGGDLKERSIGIEVFCRTPNYDANADPVVRITAGEVRKRLGLYYYDSTHAGEQVNELPVGSYVPLFRQADGFNAPTPGIVEPAPSLLPLAPELPTAPSSTADLPD